jgi:hypothetical protein
VAQGDLLARGCGTYFCSYLVRIKMTATYQEVINRKMIRPIQDGFKADLSSTALYPFQRELTEWALMLGRAAIFADCGLGKSPMQLHWADQVVNHTGGNVLILAPLAVAEQTVREGKKFGIEVHHGRTGDKCKITVTNYARLQHYSPSDFAGIVCDESSIIKNQSGEMRKAITAFMREIRFRLLCTATPSPNDYMELGTSCEALGVMRYHEMLSMFFFHDAGDTSQWVLKGHAESAFWRFVASWARAVRYPSDLGFDDELFKLPELKMEQHTIKSKPQDGRLFVVEALTLDDQRAERRETIDERCDMVAKIANANSEPFLAWCSLNTESEQLCNRINGAVEVCGGDDDDDKAEKMLAFSAGKIRCIVTKPSIAGFGMNWQHCNQMSFFPSHSHEQFYQCLRRCWRFGQTRPVTVHIVTSEAERAVLENMNRKEKAAKHMMDQIVSHMSEFYKSGKTTYNPMKKMEIPQWMQRA